MHLVTENERPKPKAPEITTTITITLKHSRALTEAEFKNLTGNIFEHVANEHGEELKAEPVNPWGFADIDHVAGRAFHQVDGKDAHPERKWGWTMPKREAAA